MTRVENYIQMIKEFYYLKNGKQNTIDFLEYMIEQFKDTYDYEWEINEDKKSKCN